MANRTPDFRYVEGDEESFGLHFTVDGDPADLADYFTSVVAKCRRGNGMQFDRTFTFSGSSASFVWQTDDLVQGVIRMSLLFTSVEGGRPKKYPARRPLLISIRGEDAGDIDDDDELIGEDGVTIELTEGTVTLESVLIAGGAHADEHLEGGDDAIDLATTGTAGLMSAADKVILDGLSASMMVIASAQVDFDNDGDSTLYTVPTGKILVPYFVHATRVSGGDGGAADQFSLGKNASRYDLMGASLGAGARTLNGLIAGGARLFSLPATPFYQGSSPNIGGQETQVLVAGNTITLAKLGGSGNGLVAKIGLVGILLDA